MEFYRFFKGPEAGLKDIPKHRGYIYFCYDTGYLYIDILSDEPANEEHGPIEGKRVQVNAVSAKYLIDSEGNQIDIDHLLTGDTLISVPNGGTGQTTFEENSLLVGHGENPIGSVSGTGVLISKENGLQFSEVLPAELGGTGFSSIEELIQNFNISTQTNLDEILGLLDNKQDIIQGTQGQFVRFDDNGNLVAEDINLVNSFNGRTGAVIPQNGDYTAAMVGARSNSWMPTASEVGAATMTEVNAAIQQAIQNTWAASY